MNLIPNAGQVAVKSWAVWVGYVAAGLLAVAGLLGTAPPEVQQALHTTALIPTMKWLAGGLAGPGVQVARILQQSFGGAP